MAATPDFAWSGHPARDIQGLEAALLTAGAQANDCGHVPRYPLLTLFAGHYGAELVRPTGRQLPRRRASDVFLAAAVR